MCVCLCVCVCVCVCVGICFSQEQCNMWPKVFPVFGVPLMHEAICTQPIVSNIKYLQFHILWIVSKFLGVM
jgi:hypothetical protein